MSTVCCRNHICRWRILFKRLLTLWTYAYQMDMSKRHSYIYDFTTIQHNGKTESVTNISMHLGRVSRIFWNERFRVSRKSWRNISSVVVVVNGSYEQYNNGRSYYPSRIFKYGCVSSIFQWYHAINGNSKKYICVNPLRHSFTAYLQDHYQFCSFTTYQ